MDRQTAVVGSLDAWLPSCCTHVLSAARPSHPNQRYPSCSTAQVIGNHGHVDAPASTSAAAPVPIPFSRAVSAARPCSPRASPVDEDDDSDDAMPLDTDFLDCMARKQHSFLTQAMASRRSATPNSGTAARESASGSNSCCGTDASGVSDGRSVSSLWDSSGAASSAFTRSVGWSGGSGACTFSGNGSGVACSSAFGSYSKEATACQSTAAELTAATAANYSTAALPPSACSSSCISEGTVRRGRPRLTISSACSLPGPGQVQGSVHAQSQQLGSLCKALSSPAYGPSLAASFTQRPQPQQLSFGRILPPPPHAGGHRGDDDVECIALKSGSHLSSHGHSHSASETAAAAAAFALSMISLPDNSSDSEGYESCSDREGGAQHCHNDDASSSSDEINLSASCGGSSTAAGAEPEGCDEQHAAEAARRMLQPQLAAMRHGWMQSIASACGITAPQRQPLQTQQVPPQRLAPTAAVAAAGGHVPITTRRGLFEGTVSAGSPRNAWRWHAAVGQRG